MSTTYLAENPVLVSLQKQLHTAALQLHAGMDVAPAQRLRLEGIAAALIASGADIDVLERDCVVAGAGVVVVVRNGDALHFDCWQQRAPVYPTTSD